MEFNSGRKKGKKKNKLLTRTATWMNLKTIAWNKETRHNSPNCDLISMTFKSRRNASVVVGVSSVVVCTGGRGQADCKGGQ